jgi:hypothetical protein
MSSIKSIFIAFVMSTLAVPAFADNQMVDSLIGAAAGAAAARGLCHNCNTRHKNAATAVGGLGGAWVGSSVGDASNATFNPPQRRQQQMANVDQNNYRRQPQSAPIGTTWINEPAAQPVQQAQYVQPVQTRVVRPTPVATNRSDCDEEYYRGEFNPELARVYCQGKRDRDRQLRQAYNDGLSGR